MFLFRISTISNRSFIINIFLPQRITTLYTKNYRHLFAHQLIISIMYLRVNTFVLLILPSLFGFLFYEQCWDEINIIKAKLESESRGFWRAMALDDDRRGQLVRQIINRFVLNFCMFILVRPPFDLLIHKSKWSNCDDYYHSWDSFLATVSQIYFKLWFLSF